MSEFWKKDNERPKSIVWQLKAIYKQETMKSILWNMFHLKGIVSLCWRPIVDLRLVCALLSGFYLFDKFHISILNNTTYLFVTIHLCLSTLVTWVDLMWTSMAADSWKAIDVYLVNVPGLSPFRYHAISSFVFLNLQIC